MKQKRVKGRRAAQRRSKGAGAVPLLRIVESFIETSVASLSGLNRDRRYCCKSLDCAETSLALAEPSTSYAEVVYARELL